MPDDAVTDDAVSRETPPAPEEARGVFADRFPLAEQYAGWLADAGVVRGLLGPREVPRIWERHVLNSAVLAEFVPPDSTVCDIGSGAGLPGLVLAIARPDLHLTLVEPLLRRTTFLDEVVADLGLGEQVEVVRARADALHGARRFSVVTSRAVAPLPRLLEWSMPLVEPTGVLLVMKGSSARAEVADARSTLQRLGCDEPDLFDVDGTVLVGVSWSDPSRVGLPGAAQAGRERTPKRRSKRRR